MTPSLGIGICPLNCNFQGHGESRAPVCLFSQMCAKPLGALAVANQFQSKATGQATGFTLYLHMEAGAPFFRMADLAGGAILPQQSQKFLVEGAGNYLFLLMIIDVLGVGNQLG